MIATRPLLADVARRHRKPMALFRHFRGARMSVGGEGGGGGASDIDTRRADCGSVRDCLGRRYPLPTTTCSGKNDPKWYLSVSRIGNNVGMRKRQNWLRLASIWSYSTSSSSVGTETDRTDCRLVKVRICRDDNMSIETNGTHSRMLGIRSFSTSSNSNSAENNAGTNARVEGDKVGDYDAEKAYGEYLAAKEKLKEIGNARELAKSKAMYEAWKRAEDKQGKQPHTEATKEDGTSATDSNIKQAEGDKNRKEKKSTLSGVAVVRTLVRETQKEQKKKDEEQRLYDEQTKRVNELLELAAMQFHHSKALVELGNVALRDAGNDQADDGNRRQLILRAMDLYRRGGQLGATEGWFNLGHMLWTGYPDQSTVDNQNHADPSDEVVLLEPDRAVAFDAFENAIRLGDSDAMYFVAVHLMSSETTGQQKRGYDLLQRASRAGHAGAKYYLALLHLNGRDDLNIAPCEKKFAHYLDDAASDDCLYPDALFLRGHSYYHGDSGYDVDHRLALRDFLRGADCGHADAAVSAGAILYNGVPSAGIARDRVRAFELYQHAGELGSLEGWRNVVACYATGQGVQRSEETARYIANTMLKTNREEES